MKPTPPLTVLAAQQCVLAHAAPGPIESVALHAALGRVLAEDIRANRDQPPYDVSAMDGFALRSADTAARPVSLSIVEDIRAGDLPRQTLAAGQCARIMTGAPLPRGADCVVRVELTRALAEESVEIGAGVAPGNDVRRRGENMRNGEVVLAAGTEVTPGVVGVLASVKAAEIRVHSRPSVAILATGDELEGLEDPVDPNKIPESNSYALLAQTQALGLAPELLGIARDDEAELAAYLQRGLSADVLLVSGGSSVGVHDHVRPTLEKLGVTLHFWRVEMRPGHPVAFGTTSSGSLVFGLPGNPVSSMVCFEQFVLPALRRLQGCKKVFRRTVRAKAAQAIRISAGRSEFTRVVLSRDDEGFLATPTGPQSSGALLSMAQADGLLVVPAAKGGLAAGERAVVQLLDGGFQQEPGFEG